MTLTRHLLGILTLAIAIMSAGAARCAALDAATAMSVTGDTPVKVTVAIPVASAATVIAFSAFSKEPRSRDVQLTTPSGTVCTARRTDSLGRIRAAVAPAGTSWGTVGPGCAVWNTRPGSTVSR